MGNERSLVSLTLISNESKERTNGRSHIHEDFIISPCIKESQFHAFLRGLISNLFLQTKFYSSPRSPLFLGALGKTKALLAPRACLKTMLLQAFTSRFIAWSQYLCIAKFSFLFLNLFRKLHNNSARFLHDQGSTRRGARLFSRSTRNNCRLDYIGIQKISQRLRGISRHKEIRFILFIRGLISNLSLSTKFYSSPRRPPSIVF